MWNWSPALLVMCPITAEDSQDLWLPLETGALWALQGDLLPALQPAFQHSKPSSGPRSFSQITSTINFPTTSPVFERGLLHCMSKLHENRMNTIATKNSKTTGHHSTWSEFYLSLCILKGNPLEAFTYCFFRWTKRKLIWINWLESYSEQKEKLPLYS